MIFSRSKVILVILVIVLCFQGTMAQINLNSSQINFRTSSTAVNTTNHYGDLMLKGGTAGSNWGWLYCNSILCAGASTISGSSAIHGSQVVYGSQAVYGAKYFFQPHPTDSSKIIKYIAAEAGEALTLARGTAKTQKGEATIQLPEHYSLVTSTDKPVSTVLTAINVPALLYVAKENNQKIVVKVKNSDYIEFGDVEFNYYVTGLRDGFEDLEPVQDIDESNNEIMGGLNTAKPVSEKKKAYDEKVKRVMERVRNNLKDVKN
jgi:hypothetical protein